MAFWLALLPILLLSVNSSSNIPCSEIYNSAPVDGLTAVYGPVQIQNQASRLAYPDPILQLPSIVNSPAISIAFWLKARAQTPALSVYRQSFLVFNSSSTNTQLAFQFSYDSETHTATFGSEFSVSSSQSNCRLEIPFYLPTDFKYWILLSLSFDQTGYPTFKINGTDSGSSLSGTNCNSAPFTGLSNSTSVWLQPLSNSSHDLLMYNLRLYDSPFPGTTPSILFQNHPKSTIPSATSKIGFRFYRSSNDTIRTTTSTMGNGELLLDGPIRPTVTSALNLDQQFNQGRQQFLLPPSLSFWISFWIKLDTPVLSGSYSKGVLQILGTMKGYRVNTWIQQIQDITTIVLEHFEDTPICSMVNTLSTRLPADNQYHHIFIGSKAPTTNSTRRIWTICVDNAASCSNSALVAYTSIYDKVFFVVNATACTRSAPPLTFLLRQLRVKEFTDSTFDFLSEQAKAKAITFDQECTIGANGDASLFPPPLCYGRGTAFANGTCSCDYDREPGNCRKCGTNFEAVDAVGDPYYSCDCPPGYGLSTSTETCDACADGYYTSQANSICVACSLPNAVYANRTQCGLCPTGTYTDSRRGVCVSCSPGTYSSTTGSKSCDTCPAGNYSTLTSCIACPSGQVSAPGSSICTQCPTGTMPNTDHSSCISCSDGTYADHISGTCALCSFGRYRQGNASSCQACPSGQVSVANRTTCVACDEGTFTSDNIQCMPCPRGYFSNQTGSSSCFQCESGYVSLPSGRSCAACQAGTYPNTDQTACVYCPVGQYSSRSASAICSDCQPGRYADATGQTDCIQCPIGSYTADSTSTKCNYCPTNTFSSKLGSSNCTSCQANSSATNLGSTSQDSCLCRPDYFHNRTADSRGYICDLCPAEYVCTSPGVSYPGLFPGYYRDLRQPYVALKCTPEQACVVTQENNSTQCATGYEGYRCSACLSEYYRYGTKCIECGSGALGPIALVILLILGCSLILQIAQPSKHPLSSIGISLSNLQLISVFGLSVSNRWNSSVSSSFGTISILNLNINMFRPECSLGMDYWRRQQVQFFLPLVALVILFALSIARYTYNATSLLFRQGEAANELKEESKHRFIFACIILMLHGYTIAIATATGPLSCEDVGAGRYFMKQDPSIECSGADYYDHVGTSMLVFAAYASVIPIVITAVLLFHYNNSTLFTAKFQRSFGALTSPYNASCFWWEIVNLLRKLLVVLATNVLQSIYMQLFVVLSLLFAAMVFQIFCYPYRTLEENRLSIMWNIVAILILFSAGVLEAGGAQSGSEGFTLEIMIFVSLLLTILYSFYTVWTEIQIRAGKPAKTVVSDFVNQDLTDTSFFVSDHGGGFNAAFEGHEFKRDYPVVVGPTARSVAAQYYDPVVRNPSTSAVLPVQKVGSFKTSNTHNSAKDGEQVEVEALSFIDESEPQPENQENMDF